MGSFLESFLQPPMDRGIIKYSQLIIIFLQLSFTQELNSFMVIQIFNHIHIPTAVQNAVFFTAKTAGLSFLTWHAGDLIEEAKTVLPSLKQLFRKPNLSPNDIGIKKFVEQNLLSVSDRAFQHVLGESFGKASGLEGIGSVEMTGHLLDILHERIQAMQDAPCIAEEQDRFCRDYLLDSGDSALSRFAQLSRQMETAVRLRDAFDRSPQRFYDLFSKETENLGIGESFFFQGGVGR